MPIYTGNGDNGFSSIINKHNISKASPVFEALGSLDETGAALGLAKSYTRDETLSRDIAAVQNRLIQICGELSGGRKTVSENCPAALESMIDSYSAKTGGFCGFTVSGISSCESALNLARTSVRRAERAIAELSVTPDMRKYINRLSDLLYVMSQYAALDSRIKSAVNAEAGEAVSGLTQLDRAKALSLAVEKKAAEIGVNAVVAVADAGANIILLHSMDNAYIASAEIARSKAYTSAALKMSTADALKLSKEGGALEGLTATSSNGIILLGGGEPLMKDNQLLGALGVSGGTAEEDTYLAKYGRTFYEKLNK